MTSFLPHEQHRQDEVKKVFARAATLEPAESSPKHVYPKLPDHDDLAARPQEEDKDIKLLKIACWCFYCKILTIWELYKIIIHGTILVNDKVKEMNEKFQVSEKTKSAMSAAERSVPTARSAIMRNCYVFTRAAWVTGAYNRVAKKAKQVRQKTKEKVLAEDDNNQGKDEGNVHTIKPEPTKPESQPPNPPSPKGNKGVPSIIIMGYDGSGRSGPPPALPHAIGGGGANADLGLHGGIGARGGSGIVDGARGGSEYGDKIFCIVIRGKDSNALFSRDQSAKDIHSLSVGYVVSDCSSFGFRFVLYTHMSYVKSS
ncbi:hypothetical protein RJT34_23730 [Clitoria ternatea]|uniref:Uncharacterized protein n=1 Tax=Clitoria ternatea TaxID=43366 RepID=A0AAN9IHF7_CLITE